jgi:predicted CoA-binding protein
MVHYAEEVNAMGKTSSEVSERYKKKTYKFIPVRFRYDTDQRLLEFLDDYKDQIGMTQIFREALDQYITDNFPYYGKE